MPTFLVTKYLVFTRIVVASNPEQAEKICKDCKESELTTLIKRDWKATQLPMAEVKS